MDKFQAIRNICLTASTTFDLTGILASILAATDIMFPSAASYILLLDNTTGKVQPGACRNLNEHDWRASLATADFSLENLAARGMSDNGPMSLRKFHHSQGFVSCFGLPLIARKVSVGALFLLTRVDHKLTGDEVDYVETLTALAAMAIADARLYWSNQQLTHDLFADEEHIQTLIASLRNAQEEQARRIARMLHDESAQLLASVYIALDRTAKRVAPELKAQIGETKNLLDQIEARLRTLAHELYPTILDDLGLDASLKFLAAQIADRKEIAITIENQLRERLTAPKQLTLYRVVQEALNNVARHAQASQTHIRLIENDTSIYCSIRDNGAGFKPEPLAGRGAPSHSHLGLSGMRERVATVGGTLEILSTPGRGTEILIKIPKKLTPPLRDQISSSIAHKCDN
jgi:signal transduction histidine kinase